MTADALVIVGASLAGAKAAEGARQQGWTGPIRLVGTECHLPYERPPLSKSVLVSAEPPQADVHPNDFYAANEIDLLLGRTALGIDLGDRVVTLDDETRLPYAKLVIATGCRPRRLRISGGDLPQVLALRTVDDALALRDQLRPGRRVAVVGGSWIGTEVAAGARQRGCEVTLIDPLSTPLERVLGVEVGRYVAHLHASRGVQLRMGARVEAIVGSTHVEGVRLADGAVVEADLVVGAVGVVPNIELARDAGLAVGTGVLTDRYLQTSHPDVYAAGDIAEAEHPVLGRRVRFEHWANALNQGATAGRNAAGGGRSYERIPYFFSDQYDMQMEHSGWPVPWDQIVFRGRPQDGAFVAFYLAGGRLVAGANINVPSVNSHVQMLIRRSQRVDPAVLADLDVEPGDWVHQASTDPPIR